MINTNHYLLGAMNLSCPNIENIKEICLKYEVPCKITGSGYIKNIQEKEDSVYLLSEKKQKKYYF